MFEELSSLFTTDNDDETLPESIRTEIVQHLTALEDEFERYFPEINGDELDLVRNPFRPLASPKKIYFILKCIKLYSKI